MQKVYQVLIVMFALSANVARADVENEWEPLKISSSALTAGVQACMKEASKTLPYPQNMFYCGCIMDATALSPEPGVNQIVQTTWMPHVRRCVAWAKAVPENATFMVRTPYAKGEFMTSIAITEMMLYATNKAKNKVKDFLKRELMATCLVDATRYYRVMPESLPKSAFIRCERHVK